MKVWADTEEVTWYALHTDDAAYGEQFGYTVIDVPADTVARWQRVLAEAQGVLTEISAAMDAQEEGRP